MPRDDDDIDWAKDLMRKYFQVETPVVSTQAVVYMLRYDFNRRESLWEPTADERPCSVTIYHNASVGTYRVFACGAEDPSQVVINASVTATTHYSKLSPSFGQWSANSTTFWGFAFSTTDLADEFATGFEGVLAKLNPAEAEAEEEEVIEEELEEEEHEELELVEEEGEQLGEEEQEELEWLEEEEEQEVIEQLEEEEPEEEVEEEEQVQQDEALRSFQLMFSFLGRRKGICGMIEDENETLLEESNENDSLLPFLEGPDCTSLDFPILELESQFQAYLELQAEIHRSPEARLVSKRDSIMKSLFESKAMEDWPPIPVDEMALTCAKLIELWEAAGEGAEEDVSSTQALAEYQAFVERQKEGKQAVDGAVMEGRIALAAVLEGLTENLRSDEKELPSEDEFVEAATKLNEALVARKRWEKAEVEPQLNRCWRSELARWKEFRTKIQRATSLGERLVEWKERTQVCAERPRFSPEEYKATLEQKEDLKDEMTILQSKLNVARKRGRGAELESEVANLNKSLREIEKSLKEQRSRLSMLDIYPEDRLHIASLAETSSKSLTEFEQLEEISSGDRHVVYKAEYEDKPCILKRFQLRSDSQRKAFIRESEILRRLSHPNIVRIDDTFLEGDFGYLQMPVYQPLSAARSKSFVVRTVLLDVLLGLEYCHAHGVIHCDVKIENILLDSTGRACLADFDISRDAQSRTTTANLGGTLAYLAPEVLTGGGHSAASDMFSFGLLALDLVDPSQTRSGTRLQPVIPGKVEVKLKELLRALFSKEPAKRPTATQCRSHAYFTTVPVPDRCPICFEFGDGLKCGEGHFVCNSCLGECVDEFVKKDIAQKRKVGGVLRCSSFRCLEPYSEADLAVRISSKRMQEYLKVRLDLHEERLVADFQKELEATKRAWAAQGREEQIKRHVDHITEWILTLRCPSAGCNTPFVDFKGCGALKCRRCLCNFCCWCLADCGADAHPHVLRCDWNPSPAEYGVFTTEAAFQKGQRKRKRRMTRAYLEGLSTDIRAAVEEVVAPLLKK